MHRLNSTVLLRLMEYSMVRWFPIIWKLRMAQHFFHAMIALNWRLLLIASGGKSLFNVHLFPTGRIHFSDADVILIFLTNKTVLFVCVCVCSFSSVVAACNSISMNLPSLCITFSACIWYHQLWTPKDVVSPSNFVTHLLHNHTVNVTNYNDINGREWKKEHHILISNINVRWKSSHRNWLK